jgi:hypothetical protein
MISPHELAESQYTMSQEYSKLSAELGGLRKNKSIAWLELRKNCDTDKQAEMLWESSEEGQRATQIPFILKGLEKEMSSAKALLKTLSDEAHNQY